MGWLLNGKEVSPIGSVHPTRGSDKEKPAQRPQFCLTDKDGWGWNGPCSSAPARPKQGLRARRRARRTSSAAPASGACLFPAPGVPEGRGHLCGAMSREGCRPRVAALPYRAGRRGRGAPPAAPRPQCSAGGDCARLPLPAGAAERQSSAASRARGEGPSAGPGRGGGAAEPVAAADQPRTRPTREEAPQARLAAELCRSCVRQSLGKGEEM